MDFPSLRDYCASTLAGWVMRNNNGSDLDRHRAGRLPRVIGNHLKRTILVAVAASVLLFSTAGPGEAASFRQGVSAFNRQDYASASQIFIPLAEQGEPSAQTYLGFMFETGRGVPQNYTEAAMWYRRAAEQGDSLAQYSLGLLYDRGFGVPRDIVEANKWLNLSTAAAPPRAREARARIRDAVTTKMTRGEIAQARRRALEWAPSRER
jgi:TPR repeat protein